MTVFAARASDLIALYLHFLVSALKSVERVKGISRLVRRGHEARVELFPNPIPPARHFGPRDPGRASQPASPSDDPDETLCGPIVVYKRKRFSLAEVRTIWKRSCHRCHLCGKVWKLSQRGRYGWHIDHVIPNIGGGHKTEEMSNFRVACATCNLRKGRGYTSKIIRQALEQIL